MTFFPFLSNFCTYLFLRYNLVPLKMFTFLLSFSQPSEVRTRNSVKKKKKRIRTRFYFRSGRYFELHELANRSFTWSKYGRKCLFLFQKRRTVEVKFKERKKNIYAFSLVTFFLFLLVSRFEMSTYDYVLQETD